MIFLVYGDCLKKLKELDDNSVDALITDPPAGISFMNKSWDDDKGGRDSWIAWMSEIMTECIRVMKPGSHGLVWAIPRTSHWTATALEDAGFEVRDVITHLFGTGFPKSLNISKAIDKEAGAEREITEPIIRLGDKKAYSLDKSHFKNHEENKENIKYNTSPATDEAKQYNGWGTALKPASEHWVLVRKPLSEKTVAKNVLKYGTGGINIDACRISVSENDPNHRVPSQGNNGENSMFGVGGHNGNLQPQGRFPANLVLSHNHDCECIGTKEVKAISHSTQDSEIKSWKNSSDKINHKGYGENGKETVSNYKCTEGCAVAALDKQSGVLKSAGKYKEETLNSEMNNKSIFGCGIGRPTKYAGDSGGASRFFYCAKASKADKNKGLEDLQEEKVNDGRETSIDNPFQRGETQRLNTHPTVKNTSLMEYLIKLVTPENGVVLDPFMGSGSTALACIKLEKEFIGIEKELEYFIISEKRAKNLSEEVYCF